MSSGQSNAKQPCVYILASQTRGTLYVGVTSDLLKRVREHKEGTYSGFTKRYGIARLVWYEVHGSMESAIKREKQIKKWDRIWKVELIEKMNSDWRDLFDEVV